ncbi:hypothetical protein GW17_00015730 [Ensete ventricosum]|nr:hypothetical protein GW17_00015730 [Ensete ventricosum]
MKSWSIIQRMSWLGLSLLGLNDSFSLINVLYSAHIKCVPFLPYNRSVCQLVGLLEKFKSKIRSQICKKSSKILLDAGEKVHVQLQHAESQIEADLGKFLGIGNSKGKCLESKFQEASHRKLLLQVEGAIESQISDAETRVATLHKVSSLNSCSN